MISLTDAEEALRTGRLDDAEAGFRAGLDPEALHGLGLVWYRRGDAARAVPFIEAAHAAAPTPRSAHNLALACMGCGRDAEAEALHRWCVKAHPTYLPAWFALARRDNAVLVELAERAAQAGDEVVTRAAVDALTDAHPGTLRLANLLRILGWNALCEQVLALRREPNDVGAALTRALCHLTAVHSDEAEIEARRAAYAQALADTAALTDRATPEELRRSAEAIGLTNPFLLAYHGRNDRQLQRLYGGILHRLAAADAWPEAALPRPRAGERIRVGFVSAWLHLHSVAKTFGGWIEQLDRSRFQVFGYQLSDARDALSERIEAFCDGYARGVASARSWRDRIVADAPHVLIYLDIGMEQTAPRLAARRLAALQCVTWGHPVTTGLPAIDAFLSSELMEPADGQDHYTETLVRLPGSSMYYEPLATEGGRLRRADLGLADDAVVYLSCQSLFKYRPAFDGVFPMIAARVPAARFLFLGRDGTVEARLFRDRLARVFAAHGLDWRRFCVFAEPVEPSLFPSLLDCADVFLDSIGWSGCNTTLEAITRGLPVVTLAGETMRGSHSAALLRAMGLADWVCAGVDDYVSLAARLAAAGDRAAFAALVRGRRERLWRDPAPVRALERFLTERLAGEEERKSTDSH